MTQKRITNWAGQDVAEPCTGVFPNVLIPAPAPAAALQAERGRMDTNLRYVNYFLNRPQISNFENFENFL